MSMLAKLKVRDVTAHIRGDDPSRPVQVGYDGTRVVMVLDVDHANFLAKLLANVDSKPANNTGVDWVHQVDKEQQDTWLHAMVDVLASVTHVNGTPVPLALVPAVPGVVVQ